MSKSNIKKIRKLDAAQISESVVMLSWEACTQISKCLIYENVENTQITNF